MRWGGHVELAFEDGWRSYLVRVARLEAEMSQPQFPRLEPANRLNYSKFTTTRYSTGARHYFRPPHGGRRAFVELSGGIEQLEAPLRIMNDVSASTLTATAPYWAAGIGTQLSPAYGFRIEVALEIGHSKYGAWHIDGNKREGGEKLTGWNYGLRFGVRRSLW